MISSDVKKRSSRINPELASRLAGLRAPLLRTAPPLRPPQEPAAAGAAPSAQTEPEPAIPQGLLPTVEPEPPAQGDTLRPVLEDQTPATVAATADGGQEPAALPPTRRQEKRAPAAPRRAEPAEDQPSACNRRAPRRATAAAAQIFRDGSQTPVPCRIRDLSATGARLLLVSLNGKDQPLDSASLPSEFDLAFMLDRVEAPCRMQWRRGHEVGVRFLAPLRPSPRFEPVRKVALKPAPTRTLLGLKLKA
jgi:hypothetical protein